MIFVQSEGITLATVLSPSGKLTTLVTWIFHVSQGPRVKRGLGYWYRSLWKNRYNIVLLAVVNISITTATELVSRTFAAPIAGAEDQHFFVKNETGAYTIHRQSMTNIWMTLFASVLGGPVHFFSRRRDRFLFFVGFGCLNSVFSQAMSGWMRGGGVALIAANRLLFDLCYNASWKFIFFELGRKPILRAGFNVVRIGRVRVAQDLCSTFFRVWLLTLLKFKG